ncbi:hypothetical protein EHS25_007800 [Saitozyma podzolica]|uniref:C2H2-type domain-containing protein n=1 Tax=Saitozyma podzolica TaxID=1890683 RepID=A0A427YQQ3_9TREE|nr:hypothetical protein EHS25_007800 [Saitozyma podzolica]
MPDCDDCDRWFGSWNALNQHRRNSPRHAYCFDCEEEHYTWNRLERHYRESYDHNWCEICQADFDDEEDLDEHREDDHEQCPRCDAWLKDQAAYELHAEDKHWWCKPCDRFFNSGHNLEAHRNSSIHKTKDFKCPFCPRMAVSSSAMIAHLESGTCRSGITRAMIDDWAFNHHTGMYDCYFCSADFRYLQQLNQHLASPKHTKRDQKLYRCPGCRAETETLSGLVSHVERGGCGFRQTRMGGAAIDQLQVGLQRMAIRSS